MPRLIVLRGQQRLLEYKLKPGKTLVGRSDACDILVPGDTISRTHCTIRSSGERWVLTDRSRHGTVLNERAVQGQVALSEGDAIGLGDFILQFTLLEAQVEPTASHKVSEPPPELLVSVDEGVHIERLMLVIDEGPDKERAFGLTRSRQSVGGPGSDITLSDEALLPEHLRLRVTRGRAILEPGRGAAILDGERVTVPIPVYQGEQVRIGSTVFHLEPMVLNEGASADRFGAMVGVSEPARRIFGVLRRIAVHDAPVLLLGESGTGKELAARGLHSEGRRTGRPFVAVNCSAISETLFESELFGHEKGAFTGADRRHDGAFQRADGGTLFLDEVGELPESAQAKLLRALETGEVRRVGGSAVQYPDVRVVAATNRDLAREVDEGRFRTDLYFRLAVLAVRLPPLRERPQDLQVISEAVARKLDPNIRLSDEALAVLATHRFPGNARELRNIITRAFVLGGPQVGAQDISFSPWSFSQPAAPPVPKETNKILGAERSLLAEAWQRHSGNRAAMARELGIARSTLHYKLRRYQIGTE